MDNAFAPGRVWHRRRTPRHHRFSYRLYYSLFDVADIERLCRRSPWWSLERPNLVCFRRRDYFGDPDRPLDASIRDRVEEELGVRPSGKVMLLTHLRQWGACFNPVSFYFCLDEDSKPAFIVADIHNTPWNERHTYVLDCRAQTGPDYRFAFAKQFHVSPFLPMGLDYDWRFRLEPDSIDVHMVVIDGRSECFAAGMRLRLSPLSRTAMWRMPFSYPLLTARVVTAIYWQALRLWFKRVPFFTHPDKKTSNA